jgi:hypothetical protein
MTTFETLLTPVFNAKDVKTLNARLDYIWITNRKNMQYGDMLNLIQDAITYNLANGHTIDAANFYWKFKLLFTDFMRHKKHIEFESLEQIREQRINEHGKRNKSTAGTA